MPLLISVQYATSRKGVPHPRSVARWAGAAAPRGRGEVTVRFVAAPEARRLNRRWRARNYAPNVLSFPGMEENSARAWLGDIIICVPVIRREAQAQHKSADAHFAHMVVHGVLHLLGHDHQRQREAREMERLETTILGKLGYPDPYQAC
jgi:probable rRNA maturation factor